ncbi:glycosyltransferase family 2 protein [Calothrix sp. UHCC 0171]|uniref:glycosyltransferase family 2 protein n=1 Tax=Calothrix sp. UHCC 0171 TaxID=3110245 RepID=UPI002B1FBD4E|nr:glycosyltransferase [Calothrix sp. UHCC 0171]MEA5571605.1 glycosyltransferase [Calothrix sp. UHCC 0171]
MSQKNPHCPTLKPVPTGIKRPLWSVMIPTYNCAELLRETLTTVLMQDPGVDFMQIMVVDNHSTKDDPEAVVKELGKGRVEFFRQSENIGSVKNFQTCLELSRGQLIHLLHSDDLLCQGFYEKLAKPFIENPDLGAAFCRSIFVDEKLNWEGFSCLELSQSGILPPRWIEKIAELCRISVPSLAVVRREVYEKLGGYDSRCGMSGDWEFWVRVFANYPMWFEAQPLAMWRRHSNSTNSTNAYKSTFIQENFNTIRAILSYLPDESHQKLAKKLKQNCAFLALGSAKSLKKKGELALAIVMLLQGFKYSTSSPVLMSAIKVILQTG